MFVGSLKDQIMYPTLSEEDFELIDDESEIYMLELLECVNLQYLVSRHGGFEMIHDWSDILSLGEQQRRKISTERYLCIVLMID